MNSIQLANVLIKVLGLSVCIQGIPSFASGFVRGLLRGLTSSSGSSAAVASTSSTPYVIGALVQLALGVLLIIKSKALAEFLLKGEDEQVPKA
jgi:hypothetical protein